MLQGSAAWEIFRQSTTYWIGIASVEVERPYDDDVPFQSFTTVDCGHGDLVGYRPDCSNRQSCLRART